MLFSVGKGETDHNKNSYGIVFLIFAYYLIESIGLSFDFFCLKGCGTHWIEVEIPSFLLTLLFQGSVKSRESLVPEQTVMYSKKRFVHLKFQE